MISCIDLSHTVCHDMPCHPGDPPVSLIQEKFFEEDGYSDFLLSTGMHAGTHIDGPMHMTSGITRIDSLPLETFCGPGHLINVAGSRVIDLDENALQHIIPGSVILFYTGFDRYYNQDAYFTEHPVITEKTASLLVSGKVKMVGMDMPSPDHAPYPAHKILLEHGIPILENLTNLASLLTVKEFEILAFPLRIRADSSPARVVARIARR